MFAFQSFRLVLLVSVPVPIKLGPISVSVSAYQSLVLLVSVPVPIKLSPISVSASAYQSLVLLVSVPVPIKTFQSEERYYFLEPIIEKQC